jgi:alkylhydroperoxidase/carboxymuconolactone decarboxylase family protein YurZ
MEERMASAWQYAREYYDDGRAIESFELLAEYCPEVFEGYISLRRAAYKTPPAGALSMKDKELVILAIECMARKVNPPPTFHARKAVEAGATLQEIAEVMSLCIMIGGMLTYQEAGQFVLRAARERSQELSPPGGSVGGVRE